MSVNVVYVEGKLKGRTRCVYTKDFATDPWTDPSQRPFADLGAALNFHFVIAKERSDCGNPDVV